MTYLEQGDAWVYGQLDAATPLSAISRDYLARLNVRAARREPEHWCTNIYTVTDLLYIAAVSKIAQQEGIARVKSDKTLLPLSESFGARAALVPPGADAALLSTQLNNLMRQKVGKEGHAQMVSERLGQWHGQLEDYLAQHRAEIPAEAVDLLTDLSRVCAAAQMQLLGYPARMVQQAATGSVRG